MHISITNPDRKSRLPYFRGKAELEDYLQKTGISYAILRPAVLFGKEDILINNIAWALRRLPVFGIYGSCLCGIAARRLRRVEDYLRPLALVFVSTHKRYYEGGEIAPELTGHGHTDRVEIIRSVSASSALDGAFRVQC